MDTPIKVRKGIAKDIPRLMQLFSGVKEIANWEGEKHGKGYFYQFIGSKESLLLVAERGGKVIGGLTSWAAPKSGYAFLDNLVVDASVRGSGAGGALLRVFEQEIKKRKIPRAVMLVFNWNKRMRKVVEHYDYAATGTTIIYSKKVW